jgi:hypothetical protein
VDERRVLGMLVGRSLGISEPGIGPGRLAPEVPVPEPVDKPEGVTPLVSDEAPENVVPEPTSPMVEGVSSRNGRAGEPRLRADALAPL